MLLPHWSPEPHGVKYIRDSPDMLTMPIEKPLRALTTKKTHGSHLTSWHQRHLSHDVGLPALPQTCSWKGIYHRHSDYTAAAPTLSFDPHDAKRGVEAQAMLQPRLLYLQTLIALNALKTLLALTLLQISLSIEDAQGV